eukprot:TRINITY_DN22214_c0_g1_i1.p1 TRINITY_DN22214_c0_g1~~TRINITY_DN22214_c0_g1_i1.p1  ORF type:complete len:627 (+),score=202.10 TRINITY_DN22214_c0_g1_i1:51-1883(+)
MGKPKGGGGKKSGAQGKEKKVFKQGKKVFKEKKVEYLKKKLKKEEKRVQAKEVHDESVIKVAWKGKEKEVEKSKLQGDKKGKMLLKKIAQKRVLNADEKHRLKMLGEVGDLMKLWELVRSKNTDKVQRSKAIDQIMEFTKDTFTDDARKPDMSRIFQSVLKWGTPAVRGEIHSRLRSSLAELCVSAHSNQLVKSMIDYSNQQILTEIFGEICKSGYKILSQKNALPVLEQLHNKLNAEKQNLLVLSFFDGIELKTMEGYPKITEILTKLTPTSLDYKRIIERLFKMLSPSVTKGTFDNVLVHKLLEIMMKYGTEFEIGDMIEELSKGVVHMSRTKPGANVAGMVLVHAGGKAKKEIVKSMKHSVVDMCCSKATCFFVARVFDVCDDLTGIEKTVLAEMIQAMPDLVVDPQGSIPLLHLLTPSPDRKKKYFTFNHFDDLWHDAPDRDPLHITVLNRSYQPVTKKICSTHPAQKHPTILAQLLPSLVEALLSDPKAMAENVISRRVITELVEYTSNPKCPVKYNKSAVKALKEAVEERVNSKKKPEDEAPAAGKRKAQAVAEEEPAKKKAKPAKKAAGKKAVKKDDDDDAPVETSARKPPAKKAGKKKVVKK